MRDQPPHPTRHPALLTKKHGILVVHESAPAVIVRRVQRCSFFISCVGFQTKSPLRVGTLTHRSVRSWKALQEFLCKTIHSGLALQYLILEASLLRRKCCHELETRPSGGCVYAVPGTWCFVSGMICGHHMTRR